MCSTDSDQNASNKAPLLYFASDVHQVKFDSHFPKTHVMLNEYTFALLQDTW